MIERIRRFAIKIDDFASQKDMAELKMKKSVTVLFKQLVEAERVSLKTVLKLIKNNAEWELDYLRDYLMHLQEKKSKKDVIKPNSFFWSGKKKSLSLEKIESLPFGDETPKSKKDIR